MTVLAVAMLAPMLAAQLAPNRVFMSTPGTDYVHEVRIFHSYDIVFGGVVPPAFFYRTVYTPSVAGGNTGDTVTVDTNVSLTTTPRRAAVETPPGICGAYDVSVKACNVHSDSVCSAAVDVEDAPIDFTFGLGVAASRFTLLSGDAVNATWAEAAYRCHQAGGTLASLRTTAELSDALSILAQAKPNTSRAWVGLTDSTSEGCWAWSADALTGAGAGPLAGFWATGGAYTEPSTNSTLHDYGALDTNASGLVARRGDDHLGGIFCERTSQIPLWQMPAAMEGFYQTPGLSGSDAVCAAATAKTIGIERCTTTYSYDAARALCHDIGARLCSKAELYDDEARSAGCNVDKNAVWSDDVCGIVEGDVSDGISRHFAGVGSSDSVETRMLNDGCYEDTQEQLVACCADQPCSERGSQYWVTDESTTLDYSVCASAQPLGKGSSCSGLVTYDDAVALCSSVSARLCNKQELIENAAYGSGCRLDDDPVWTSDACGTGSREVAPPSAQEYWLAHPSSRDVCAMESTTAANAICCSTG